MKEPYYCGNSSVKPPTAHCYSLVHYALPQIPVASFLLPPPYQLAAPRWQRSNSIEPYYAGHPTLGRRYWHAHADDCAVVSDDDDDYDDDDVPAVLGTGHVVAPPSHPSISRKVSDNYHNSHSDDEDSTACIVGDTSKLAAVSGSAPLALPPHVHDLAEVNRVLVLKSDNPNILINPHARSVSATLRAPPYVSHHVTDVYASEVPRTLRDDYDVPCSAYLV
ncbi:uncharacterized protein CANTADRAFT_6834 [Suhomyces tanzawaensis NRRL Y-17324]|uniref:Uncharacterized protein n=1 Tax=Suhomyces tanzawaensis NRRL Y-17324 TaxID=984487 RepID=A0A1E4SG01_9ASCO|nr:uncharacterized protein CANTADRAFT_6834 [Suhomyces tanzawaensis NRRL Y-17324]ODV78443.1 hypothetical protein CANTADRAFT_6834 [Suhomyces tanzawaensis NRRL Y-17324]